MKIPLYQVDAFICGASLAGTPPRYVPLEQWLNDDMLQAIAAENNLAETAFYVSE